MTEVSFFYSHIDEYITSAHRGNMNKKDIKIITFLPKVLYHVVKGLLFYMEALRRTLYSPHLPQRKTYIYHDDTTLRVFLNELQLLYPARAMH